MQRFTWLLMALMAAGAIAVPGAKADVYELNFDSLPSEQGWRFRGRAERESVVYSVDGSSLSQNSVGSGDNSKAYYEQENIVNSSEPLALSFTARVLDHERTGGSSAFAGFYIIIVDVTNIFTLALFSDSVVVQGERMMLDATRFHDYRFEYQPDRSYEFSIDGQVLKTGTRSGITGGNFLRFGDQSSTENTDVEITAFRFETVSGAAPDVFVDKAVNNTFPSAGEPVEFEVTVGNIGVGTAADLVVTDKLPEDLKIPAGTAPFASVGDYDPETGEWRIGDLAEGAEAVLTVPAIVAAAAPDACITNFASADHPRDTNESNDRNSALVRTNDIDHCVDLDINFGISAGPVRIGWPECDSEGQYSGEVEVTNNGPDVARNVVVSISQSPVVGPNLRFDDPVCSNLPAARCKLNAIAPGETVAIEVTSDPYRSYKKFRQTISVAATTSDIETDPVNNNVSATGSGGGFSKCTDLAIDLGPDVVPAGCFIATAAYGTDTHDDLDVLRDFRDRRLLTNTVGSAIVKFYYRNSPPLADFIAQRDWMRAIVRLALAPIVVAIKHPVTMAVSLAGFILALLLVRRRRRTSRNTTAPT